MSQNEIMNLEARIELIQKYEADAKALQEKADDLKNSIKNQMTTMGTEQITTPNFVIRFIDVLSSRFDTKRFKEDMGEDIYSYYTKQIASKKFTIS